jgi:hypothetical protein
MDSKQTVVLFFATAHNQEITSQLKELSDSFPNSHICGCSTAGEIFDTSLYDHSISIAIIHFSNTQIRSAFANLAGQNDISQACEIFAQNLYSDDLKGILVLSEGLNVNATQVLNGISRVTGTDIIVTGGLAGDGDRFQETWTFCNGKTMKDAICAIAFYGDAIRIGHGSKGGWDIFGPDRLITKSQENTLYELDGQPALALYKKYLGERADGLPATGLLFPLALNKSIDLRDKEVVRTILSVNEEEQSITFAGDMPEGYYARLMRANFDRLIDGAADAAAEITAVIPNDENTLAISISCVGRRLVLGERAEEEIEVVLDALPAGTQQIGFYSYGEISPQASGECDLHNQTMTITTISEQV